MSDVKWTKEQREVIDSRNSNLLVSAAAGSGKTAVLIERIIELILDEKNPMDINKLLVVTFTKAAASEMRERVGKAIEKKLEETPENEHLQKQLLLLSGADITTIDSFCKNVLTSYAHLVNLDSNIKVIESVESEILAKEVIEDLFEELYENKDESFLRLVNWYAKKNTDSMLSNILLNVNNFVNSHPFPKVWLNEKAEFYNTSNKDDNFYLENYILDIANSVNTNLEFFELSIKNNLKKIEDYSEFENYVDCYNVLLDKLCEVKESLKLFLNSRENLEDLIKISDEYLDTNFIKFSIPRKCDEEIKAIYYVAKKELDSLKKKIEESLDGLKVNVEDIKKESEYIYPYIRAISDIVIKFKEKFWEKKQKLNSIDFADMEHLALDILVDFDENGNFKPSKIALDYQKRYDEVFIDEYQDSNLVQEILLSAVAKENNRFMVGDVKQSIYRFRQADPSIFMEKYESYKKAEEDFESLNKKIMLYANFRSRSEILDGTNLIFSKIMRKETGELDYTVDERLNPMASFKETDKNVGGAVEIFIVDEKIDDEDEEINLTDEYSEEFEEIKTFKLECIKIANTIYNMINTKENSFMVYDKTLDDYRKIKYKDIVILMRSPSVKAKILEEVFLEYNIPLYSENKGGYFDTFEVDTIINLLKIIDNPMQDIPLISIMYSPIYNFTVAELSEIRLVDRKLKFYELLIKILEDENINIRENLKEKISKFISDLKLFSKKKNLISTDELIWFLYKYTGYYNYVGILERGERRKTNLMLLFEKAKNYEKNSYKGLFNFINYVQKVSFKNEDSEAKILSEEEDIVRLMTIHSSKGLEFPIVFLSNTDKSLKKKSNKKEETNLLLHQKLGFGAVVYNMDKKICFDSIMKKKIKNIKEKEQIAEEMRLLYVAMTRAKEKLIITGKVKGYEELKEEINSNLDERGNLSSYKIIHSENYLEWILSSIQNLNVCGKTLNCLGKEQNCLGSGDLKFQIDISNKADEFKEYQRIKEEIKSKNICLEEDIAQEKAEKLSIKEFLNERFDKEYAYKNILDKPSSITVSEVKKMIQEDEEDKHKKYYSENLVLKTPSFIHQGEEKVEFNSAEKGTIFHLAMQLLDFLKFDMEDVSKIKEEIKRQINSFVEKNIMTVEESNTININWIVKFVQSDIFKEIYISNKFGKLYKEKAIDYNLKLKNLYKDENISEDEKIMVVGIIDLFFENEKGEIILLDYKTDYVTKENLEEVKNRYKIQLDLYKSAIEEISGKKVVKKGLYLFGINEYVEV